MLIDEIYKRIKEEIVNDPELIGYLGKTEEEIVILLNSPVVRQRIEYDTQPPPISRILAGLAKAPNFIEKDDVTQAQKAV